MPSPSGDGMDARTHKAKALSRGQWALDPAYAVSLNLKFPPGTLRVPPTSSSSSTSQVLDARTPSLPSRFPTPRPARVALDDESGMPRWPRRVRIREHEKQPDSAAFEIHILWPFRRQPSPMRSARVSSANASLPERASESA